MKISVVTAVYNRQQTVGQALDSVLSQTYPAVESIVIDGASTAGTLAVLEQYRARLGVFVSERDQGVTTRSTRVSNMPPATWMVFCMPMMFLKTERCFPRSQLLFRIRLSTQCMPTLCMFDMTIEGR